MKSSATRDIGLLQAILGDGRFLLSLTGIALFMSGGFAIGQSVNGQLLPHDVHALGMDAAALGKHTSAHLVGFMFHDRVAFGGTLLAIGVAYWWLAEFPLSEGAAWSWWTFAISGCCGFLSFLAYLGYGYLDTWHGVATLFLLPVFLCGLWQARKFISGSLRMAVWRSGYQATTGVEIAGRRLLLFFGLGLMGAGITILIIGMTIVFVPQDTAFIGISPAKLRELTPLLVPVLAHDRAGFGGGLVALSVILIMIVRHAPLSRNLVEVIALMGLCGFGGALGVHFAIGYTDFVHLAPAYASFPLFIAGCGFLARAYKIPRSLAVSG